MSQWYFEEMFTFVEVTGAVAMWHLKKHIHPGIVKLWTHLRKYTLYFLQYRPGQHTVQQVKAAQSELLKYAEYCQKNLNGHLLTSLLHRACFHIPQQVLMGLPGAFSREDWGERCVRFMKQFVTGHALTKVAQASAATLLALMALRQNANRWPGVDVPTRLATEKKSRFVWDTTDDCGVKLGALKDAHGDGGERNKVSNGMIHSHGCIPPHQVTSCCGYHHSFWLH